MKAAKPHSWKQTPSPHATVLAGLPWSALEGWHRRPNKMVPATPMSLTEEERYRIIELAAQRHANRLRVTPESDLRDWLDAEEEVTSH